MSSINNAFNPDLSNLYLQQLQKSSLYGASHVIDSRQLFYQLNQPEAYQQIMPIAYDFIGQHLKLVEDDSSSFTMSEYSVENLEWLKVTRIAPLPDPLLTEDNLLECVSQTTPIMLTQPCWLQNCSPSAYSSHFFAVQLMSVYSQITGRGRGEFDLFECYRAFLTATINEIPVLHSITFSQQNNLISGMIDFATLQLALARFPRVFFAEILGFTLAYSQMPTLIDLCFPAHSFPAHFFKLRLQRVEKQITPICDCIRTYLDIFPQQRPALWARVLKGYLLYQQQMQRCRDQLSYSFENPLSLESKVALLLQQKAAAAMGHHQKIQLHGQSLDTWFKQMPGNSPQFIQALKQSRYINLQQPAESLLLKLFDFKGPMFGVLTDEEFETLTTWLKNGLKACASHDKKDLKSTFSSSHSLEKANAVKRFKRLSNRELYYYLLNTDLYPAVLPVAQAKISKLLRLCAFFNPPPFKHYNHQQFDNYIASIYQTEINKYHPLQGKPKISKEAYIWGIEQIAPMILIDGCWLQNSLAVQNINPGISDILFRIYSDEIGNGQQVQNHPYIFQQLLQSLSIDLPPVDTKAFAEHAGFIDSAFDLPVFMLSLSSSTVEFLPELLGLNMAIELSGLGNSYMTLVDEWNYWGIDSTIASIHISIDNVASGHTFLAKKAIQLYMDEKMRHTGDHVVLDNYWRRIYSGYASLRFVGIRFKLGLPVCYLIKKLCLVSNDFR